jgi:hypothetical protein
MYTVFVLCVISIELVPSGLTSVFYQAIFAIVEPRQEILNDGQSNVLAVKRDPTPNDSFPDKNYDDYQSLPPSPDARPAYLYCPYTVLRNQNVG